MVIHQDFFQFIVFQYIVFYFFIYVIHEFAFDNYSNKSKY